MEGWKPNSQHIRLAVTHPVVIKIDATFPPHTTFQQLVSSVTSTISPFGAGCGKIRAPTMMEMTVDGTLLPAANTSFNISITLG